MTSRIPKDLLLSSPEEAAAKIATYMVLSRQVDGFLKSADDSPWYEDVGSSISDFWQRNVADPVRGLGASAGDTFSEYWDKYVDSVTGARGPDAQTLSWAGTGAGLGGIYGLVNELSKKRKQRSWENPLLYAGLGGALGGGAGLAYQHIPGVRDTVSNVRDAINPQPEMTNQQKREAIEHVDKVKTKERTGDYSGPPLRPYTARELEAYNDFLAQQGVEQQELMRALIGSLDPRTQAHLMFRSVFGIPMPEWLSETGIPGTDGFNPLGTAHGLGLGLGGRAAMQKIKGARIPSIEDIQVHLNEIGGQGVTESQASSIRQELIKYKNKLTSRLPLPFSGRGKLGPGRMFLNMETGKAQSTRPPLTPQYSESARTPAPQSSPPKMPGGVALDLTNKFHQLGLDRKQANQLVKDLEATGGDFKRVRELVEGLRVKTRVPDILGGTTKKPFKVEKMPNGSIYIREKNPVAGITRPQPTAEIFNAPGAAEYLERPGPDVELAIQERFNLNPASTSGVIEKIHSANARLAKLSQLGRLSGSAIDTEVAKVNSQLSEFKSQRGYQLVVEYDKAANQWNIKENVPSRSRGWKLPWTRGRYESRVPRGSAIKPTASFRYDDTRAPMGKDYLELTRKQLKQLRKNPTSRGWGALITAILAGAGGVSDIANWSARRSRAQAMPGAQLGTSPLDNAIRVQRAKEKMRQD